MGRALDAGLWLVAGLVAVYSLANVHTAARGHGTADPQAWLLAPIVDIALFVAITADAALSRHGERPDGWATGLRWFCGIATWTLNVWDAAASGDPGAIVAHSIPPVVLVLLAEAAPRYRQRFAALTTAPAPALEATAGPLVATVEPTPAHPGPPADHPGPPAGPSVDRPGPSAGPEAGHGGPVGLVGGSTRHQVAALVARIPADDPRSDRQLATEWAPLVGVTVSTVHNHLSALRRAEVTSR
ncbi:winged helix-turn-helix domain-containing protein [Candidatus Protofrankia datiscae]|uniref:winged helix-turn-helix domain-containing protein n=1 Tax=Candidatus Protofrankia datiscae TaxID=2716812 RepID=UPI001ED949AF|nr:winged helix-turn-helix domain-containing protein [Candidatus Protofrankia datiscae]